MQSERVKEFKKNNFKKILQYFFQGLIVLAPICVTVWVIFNFFNWVDGIIPNIAHSIVPSIVKKDVEGNVERIPGLGFIVVIAVILFTGWLSSYFMVGRLVEVLDKVLERTPGIKFIYSSVKDFLEAFAGNKKKFDKPVLVNVDANDVWRVGFITAENANEFGMHEHTVVYVPHSYAISGITYFVPKERIKPLKDIAAADAMKFSVSGGVAHFKED